jgi:hypothetical protein
MTTTKTAKSLPGFGRGTPNSSSKLETPSVLLKLASANHEEFSDSVPVIKSIEIEQLEPAQVRKKIAIVLRELVEVREIEDVVDQMLNLRSCVEIYVKSQNSHSEDFNSEFSEIIIEMVFDKSVECKEEDEIIAVANFCGESLRTGFLSEEDFKKGQFF